MQRQRIPEPPAPVDLLAALRETGDAFLLQSADGPRRLARFSILGFDPTTHLRADADTVTIDGEPTNQAPTDAMRTLTEPYQTNADEGYPFNGGLVGYIGYEYATRLEDLPRPPVTDNGIGAFPDIEMGLFLDGIIYDHERRHCFYFTQDEDRFNQLPLADARTREGTPAPFKLGALSTSHNEPEYTQMVQQLQDQITAGHTFQTVLSRAFHAPYEGSPLTAYRRLLELNPSPYMFYLSFQDRDVFGSSPEGLVRVEDDRVETDPIAGTRPLGETPNETQQLETEMRESAKEQAEHAMLVDLARNDLGRVAQPGTVHVEDLMRVERYSHVQHLVSRVSAQLAPDNDALDALNAVFPAGTVSGAPKPRSMELIAELENQARGPYAGCIGYLGLNGNLDSAITIRSAWTQHNRLEVRAGAGIVADSTPHAEYEETQAKGQALLSALQGNGGWT